MFVKDDNELVLEVVNGSVSSFEELIERYQKTIFHMVLRMIGDVENAKDLTQDIFVKAFEKMGTFNFKYKFFSWFYRLAINETISWLRKNPKLAGLNEAMAYPAPENTTENDDQKIQLLQQGLLQLPEEYRSLLLLKYYCGLSYEEMAETSDISLKKVRSRLFIAREQLRKILVLKGFHENE
jgi:RNA polymerase sigma-70 factor (ECF subfamily)